MWSTGRVGSESGSGGLLTNLRCFCCSAAGDEQIFWFPSEPYSMMLHRNASVKEPLR